MRILRSCGAAIMESDALKTTVCIECGLQYEVAAEKGDWFFCSFICRENYQVLLRSKQLAAGDAEGDREVEAKSAVKKRIRRKKAAKKPAARQMINSKAKVEKHAQKNVEMIAVKDLERPKAQVYPKVRKHQSIEIVDE